MKFSGAEGEAEVLRRPTASELTPIERLLTQSDGLSLMNERPTPKRWRPDKFSLFFGVILPVFAIAIELLAQWCADAVFDPLPTVWHSILVCGVPLANFWVWHRLRRDEPRISEMVRLACGGAIGIAVFYTIVFLPLLPLGVVALIFCGVGLLPLTPPLALFISLRLAWHLRSATASPGVPPRMGVHWGALIALSLLIVAEAPRTIVRAGMKMAASSNPAEQQRGLRWLRDADREDLILRQCYPRTGIATDFLGFLLTLGDPVTIAEARAIYYRVTGRPFSTAPPPHSARLFGQGRNILFDLERGGAAVGGVSEGLSLASSRLDGSLDPEAALGYFEWTLTFHNSSASQQESRAQIALPAGGVVSRLTLWVNGEEREAAFAGRGEVRAAYEQVVRTRRDPVLVTTNGPDRILVQCFPVPPGGEMKVRVGVTAPLALTDRTHGRLRLPVMLERNFAIGREVSHEIWFESKRPLQSAHAALKSEHQAADAYALRGRLTETALAEEAPVIEADRSNNDVQVWTPDPTSKRGEVIQQHFEDVPVDIPNRVVLVIDSSAELGRFAPQIADRLSKLPAKIDLKVLVAGDEVIELTGSREMIAERVKSVAYEGGKDNVAALEKAWDLAAQMPQGLILWIHAPQPVLLREVQNLQAQWTRRPQGPRLYDLQVGNGPNRVIDKLDGVKAIDSAIVSGDPARDLDLLIGAWDDGATRPQPVREKLLSLSTSTQRDVRKTSGHLARLWALDEVRRLLAAGSKHNDEAVKVAAAYQLVTPVTGAVVLETTEQYDRAGLKPVDAGTVPTIPEPEFYLLAAAAMIVLGWAMFRRRAVCNAI